MNSHTRTNTVAIHDWDGRYFDLARRVFKSPFNRVVLTVEDRHVIWTPHLVYLAVNEFANFDIEVLLDPWGVAGKFAGEALGTPGHEEDWMKLAATTRATGILLDEPKGDLWAHTMLEWIDLRNEFAPKLEIVAGLQPERDLKTWDKHEDVDEVAVSTYFFPPRINTMGIAEVSNQLRTWHDAIPPGASVWVQTWHIRQRQSWLPKFLIESWQELGRDVNVWSWEATRHINGIAPDDPDLVWSGVMSAIKE